MSKVSVAQLLLHDLLDSEHETSMTLINVIILEH
jgi:hypothetical protein